MPDGIRISAGQRFSEPAICRPRASLFGVRLLAAAFAPRPWQPNRPRGRAHLPSHARIPRRRPCPIAAGDSGSKQPHSKGAGEQPACVAILTAAALLAAATSAWAQQTAKTQDPRGALLLLLMLPLALVAFTALEVVLWVLAPAPLVATCRALERARGRCLLFGLAAAGVTVVLLAFLGQHPAVGKTAAPLLLGVVALGCLAGTTAVTALLGRGAIELAGRSGSRALEVVLGSLLLGLVVLFPIVGQVLAMYFLLAGLGGAIMALVDSTRRKK